MTAVTLGRVTRHITRRMVESVATTLCFVGGLGLVAFGVALIALPAGLIVAGVQLSAVAVLYERGKT